MYEPPKNKHFPGNPYAGYAMASSDPAEVLKVIAYELRTLTMLEHPWIEHETVTARLKEKTND